MYFVKQFCTAPNQSMSTPCPFNSRNSRYHSVSRACSFLDGKYFETQPITELNSEQPLVTESHLELRLLIRRRANPLELEQRYRKNVVIFPAIHLFELARWRSPEKTSSEMRIHPIKFIPFYGQSSITGGMLEILNGCNSCNWCKH